MALERVKEANLSIFACSQTRALPALPALPENVRESDLYQIVNKHGRFPPIMKASSWTKAAPFKETPYHRSPSESIANNFTPSAQNLKIQSLNKIRGKRGKISADSTQILRNGENKRAKVDHAKIDSNNNNINVDNQNNYCRSRPLTPREQLSIMKSRYNIDNFDYQEPGAQDLERYYYYITNGVSENDILMPNPVTIELFVLLFSVSLPSPWLK